jgi:hypothetical protein
MGEKSMGPLLLASVAAAAAVPPVALFPPPADPATMIRYADDPGSFRGRTLTFPLRMPPGLAVGFREGSFVNGRCNFSDRVGPNRVLVQVVADVTAVQDRSPNAHAAEPVWVTFRVGPRGEATATRIVRAPGGGR